MATQPESSESPSFLKKAWDYLIPKTRKIASEYNGMVEITEFRGLKVMESKNANYSYGSLQRILRFGLQQIDRSAVQHVLLLGLGGGSVIESLRKEFGYKNRITAIEIDSVIIALAKSEFGIESDAQLNIVHEDALHFVQHTTEHFDLVIVDLFIDTEIPSALYETAFWDNINALMPVGGVIIFNAATSDAENESLTACFAYLHTLFSTQVHRHVEGTNTLVIAKKRIITP